MRQIVTILIAFLVAIPLGAGFRRLKWPPFLESAGAIVSGWILGSIVSAAAWLLWPPEGVHVRAVSVGAMDAALSFGILLAVGFVFHYILEALGKVSPRALLERALVLCALAAIWGALALSVGVAA